MIESVENTNVIIHKEEISINQDQKLDDKSTLRVKLDEVNEIVLPPVSDAVKEAVKEAIKEADIEIRVDAQGETTSGNIGNGPVRNELNSSVKNIDSNKSFTLGGTSRVSRNGNLIEHFIVVGLSADSPIGPNDKVSHDAKILYSYPPERVCDEQVVGFCFPDGIKLLQVSRRSSLTEIHAVLFKSLSQLEGSDTSFMFLITGGEHLLYVSCVLNTEPIDQMPCFFNSDATPILKTPPLDPRKQYAQSANNICIFAPRCYCVISRYPFFKAHFDFIYSILGKERLNRINSILEKPPVIERSNSKTLAMTSANDLNRISAPTGNESNLTKSLMRKPLPPLPAHATQTTPNFTPNLTGNNSPFMVSPSESPLFGSTSLSETTSLISKQSNSNLLAVNKLSKSAGHSRSHSTPISNLANIQKIRQQQLQSYQSSQSPGTITDEALSAIQESLSISEDFDDPEQMTDFTSSSNSVEFSADSSPTTANLQFEDPTSNSPSNTKVDSSKPKELTSPVDIPVAGNRGRTTLNTATTHADSPISVSPVPPTAISNHSPTDQDRSASNDTAIITESNISSSTSSVSSTSSNSSIKNKPLPKPPSTISPTMISEPISPIIVPSITNINSSTRPLALEEIEIIKYYCALKVPTEDNKLEVQPPGEHNTLTYEAGDDNFQIETWCLGGLMRTLSLKTIMLTLTCILLEKFIIVTSKNIGLISNTIFSFIPLLKPYVYQGAFIPLLPQSTLDVLHCPIPYVIGITKLPTDMPEIIDNCYILDVDDNRLIVGKKCQNIPHLPLEERLEFSLKQHHNQLWKDSGRKYSLDYPFKIIQNDYKHIHRFSNELNLYHRFFIDSIAFYIDWNPNFDFGNKEMKEKLLKVISSHHYQFVDQFLTSQLFTSHTELLFGIKNNYNSKEIILNPYKSNKL